MKRLLPAVVVVCLLTAPLGITSNAGETTGPGKTPPPTPPSTTCTENCSATSDVGLPLSTSVFLAVLDLIV